MSFAPYPPETSRSFLGGKSKGKAKRPWFSRDQSSYNTYQSGGSLTDPTSVPAAYSNDPESSAYATGSGGINEGAYLNGGGGGVESDRANAWESRFGWRIDVMAAVAYLGGPITALLFLILETQNDYVRFHAYQSALLTSPLLAIILLFNLLIPFPHFLRVLIILGSVGVTVYTAFRAWKDAQEGLSRYWLPYIGEIAERWVSEE